MLRIHFTSEDLRRVTVANGTDPLWDVLLSLHVLQDRRAPLLFDSWKSKVRAARIPSIRLLTELAPPWGYSPDFLTPGRGEDSFEAQLDVLLSTPRSLLHNDLAKLAGVGSSTKRTSTWTSTWTRSLALGDPDALRTLGTALTTYHRLALKPYEKTIRAQTEVDRGLRGQALMAGGVDRLLADLHPRLVWRSPILHIPVYAERDVRLEGRGLVLVPSLFCRIQPITLGDSLRPPVLVYPLSASIGLLRSDHEGGRKGISPIVALLGGTRAAILEAAVTDGGDNTTNLAQRLGVAAPVVSRHTAVLRQAGLIETRRSGGSVRHRVTGLGLALLNGRLPV
jgi:DNA-binding transcriptional ArsR family regulator